MKILFAAAECAPLAKVGGLGDVIGSLPKALLKAGADARVILPRYKTIPESMGEKIAELSLYFRDEKKRVAVKRTKLPGSDVFVYLLDEPTFFGSTEIYESANAVPGGEFEIQKFLFFCCCVVEFLKEQIFEPDILHVHDWHAAILPILAKANNLPQKTLLTIHNLAMQGHASTAIIASALPALADEPSIKQDISAHGSVNCLLQGIRHADAISTVSPSYAKEILTKNFGENLEEELKDRAPIAGILNGIDEAVWNESNDPLIIDHYDRFSADLKLLNKAELQQQLKLNVDPDIPLIGIVSRLTGQKGFDLLEPVRDKLEKMDIQIAVLGVGETGIENFFKDICKKHPDRFAIQEKFDERLAHRIYAASDIFLMPSRFEPCGLGQMIAMHYGSIPLVRETGGLKDSVIGLDYGKNNTASANGFSFKELEPAVLLRCTEFAAEVYRNDALTWHRLQQNAMAEDFSWKQSAKKYLDLYKKL